MEKTELELIVEDIQNSITELKHSGDTGALFIAQDDLKYYLAKFQKLCCN